MSFIDNIANYVYSDSYNNLFPSSARNEERRKALLS